NSRGWGRGVPSRGAGWPWIARPVTRARLSSSRCSERGWGGGLLSGALSADFFLGLATGERPSPLLAPGARFEAQRDPGAGPALLGRGILEDERDLVGAGLATIEIDLDLLGVQVERLRLERVVLLLLFLELRRIELHTVHILDQLDDVGVEVSAGRGL